MYHSMLCTKYYKEILMTQSEKIKLLIAYLFGILGGTIIYFTEKRDRFIRFHAMQSILLSIIPFALKIIRKIITSILGYTIWQFSPSLISWPLRMIMGIVSSVSGIASLVWLILTIICLMHAFKGEMYKLPIIGDQAERLTS